MKIFSNEMLNNEQNRFIDYQNKRKNSFNSSFYIKPLRTDQTKPSGFFSKISISNSIKRDIRHRLIPGERIRQRIRSDLTSRKNPIGFRVVDRHSDP